MTWPVVLILAAVAVVGVRLFVRGRRGRVVDDHPVCRRCGFDLTGRPAAGGHCPECGAGLSAAGAIRVGNRQRRTGLMLAGLAVAAAAGLPLGVTGGLTVTRTDPIRYAPLWWLLRDADHGTAEARWTAAAELCRRLRAGALAPADQARVVAAALRYQADLTRQWDPRWGDAIETLNGAGKLPTADWQTYLAHDEPATLTVRSRVAAGQPVTFEVRGELRGGSPATAPRASGGTDCRASVPGATLVSARPNWSGSFGSVFAITGSLELTPADWDRLPPGPHPIAVTVGAVDAGTMPNPLLFAPLHLAGTWTLLPRGTPDVQFYRDDALADQIQKTLAVRLHVQGTATANVTVSAAGPLPVDLPCDVFLVSGQEQWATSNWVDLRKGGPRGTVGMVVFRDIQALVGGHVDVVLRPTAAAAARTVGVTRLLDHDFVFHDVAVSPGP